MKKCIYLYELDNALALNRCKKSGDYNDVVYRYFGIRDKRIIKIFDCSFPLLKTILVTLSFVYIHLLFVRRLISSLLSKRPDPPSGALLCMYFFHKFSQLYKSSVGLNNGTKEYWVPGGNLNNKNDELKGKRLLNYTDYIKPNETLIILGLCYQTILYYFVKYHCYYAIYKVWDFYETYIGISNISKDNEIVFCNQSDRWAILFDSIPSRKKILIQHGIASNDIICPVRLSNVDIFYSISKSTYKDVYFSILDCKPELRFQKGSLHLSDIEKHNGIAILIVSHIVWFEKEEVLVRTLTQIGDIDIYLKKHPEVKNDQCYRDLQSAYPFNYITDAFFPNVDGVISYQSTLAYEYRDIGIPTYIYDPSKPLPIQGIKCFVNELKNNNKIR